MAVNSTMNKSNLSSLRGFVCLISIFICSFTNCWPAKIVVSKETANSRANTKRWKRIFTPFNFQLEAVNATGLQSVWAVGELGVIANFNGEIWDVTRIDFPVIPHLFAIAMIEPNDGWATGDASTVFHWNGSTWAKVTNPFQGQYCKFTSIHMFSTNDGWIGGYCQTPNDDRGLLMRWNGEEWNDVTPNIYVPSVLSIHGTSSVDMWITGNFDLVMHWDGNSWITHSLPIGKGLSLNGIFATSINSAWVVGGSGYIFHWNGNVWLIMNVPPEAYQLKSVYMSTDNEGWAVAWNQYQSSTYILHWNGLIWEIETLIDGRMAGIYVDPNSGSGWIVGETGLVYQYLNQELIQIYLPLLIKR